MRQARLANLVSSVIRSPAAIFTAAFSVRMIVAIHLLPSNAMRWFYERNEAARIAWAVVSGYGFSSPWPRTLLVPTAQQPPVYPYLLALIFRLAGPYSYPSLWIAVGINALLSSLTAVVIFRLGRRVFGMHTGLLAAWVWACWLYVAVVSIRLWESSLSAFLLTLALLLLSRLNQSLQSSYWALFGLLAALAALTNTTLLALFGFFWIQLWIRHHRAARSCTGPLLLSVAVCLVLLLPWTVRNYREFHQAIPIRDNLGLELWIGNHPGVTHLYEFAPDFPLVDPAEFNRVGEINFMQEKREIAVQFIRQHPGLFLRLCAQRCLDYWTAPLWQTWLPVSLLAWVGALFALRNRRLDALPFAIVLFVFPIIYYVTHPWSTYRHPIEPVLVLLSVYAVVTLLNAVVEFFTP